MAGTSVGEVPRKLRVVWAYFEREVNAACIGSRASLLEEMFFLCHSRIETGYESNDLFYEHTVCLFLGEGQSRLGPVWHGSS